MADQKILTGMDHAFVNTKRTGSESVILVKEGEALPADLRPGELDRLEGLGAFGPHPRDAREARLAAAVAQSGGLPIPAIDAAEVEQVLSDPTPSADVTGGAPIAG